jgi:hypothetical protein
MHRIDTADHVGNRFSDGDASLGKPGTVVDDDWLNAVQENICVFIEAMGLTLSKGNANQLRDAVLALLTRANTWTAKQTFGDIDIGTGDIALRRAGWQQLISKYGGQLVVGTVDAYNLALMRAGVTMLELTAAGVDVKSQALLGVARAVFDSITADPAAPADGTVWHRSDLDKIRARLNGATENLATESYTASYAASYTAGLATPWTALSRNGSWSDPGATYEVIKYAKTLDGFVYLRGSAKWASGGSSIVGNVLTGYKPSVTRRVPVWDVTGSTWGMCTITSNGDLQMMTTLTADHVYAFDAIRWFAES